MQRKKLLLKKNEETWLPLRWSRRGSEVKQMQVGQCCVVHHPCHSRRAGWQLSQPDTKLNAGSGCDRSVLPCKYTQTAFFCPSLQTLLSQIMALFCLQDQCKQQISGRQDGCRRLWEPLSLCWVAARIQPLILCDLHLPGANSIPPHSYQAKAPEESCCGCRLCWCGFYSF